MKHSLPFVPQFYVTAPQPCPYLEDKIERKLFTGLNDNNGIALNNTLSSTDIGYKVSAIVESKSEENAAEKILNRVELSEVEQKMILLQLYKEQAQQTFDIKRAGSLIDLFKKLNPKIGDVFKVIICKNKIKKHESTMPYMATFGGVAKGKPLLYLNSLLQVSFALNMGSFSAVHKVLSGNEWGVEVSKK